MHTLYISTHTHTHIVCSDLAPPPRSAQKFAQSRHYSGRGQPLVTSRGTVRTETSLRTKTVGLWYGTTFRHHLKDDLLVSSVSSLPNTSLTSLPNDSVDPFLTASWRLIVGMPTDCINVSALALRLRTTQSSLALHSMGDIRANRSFVRSPSKRVVKRISCKKEYIV